MKKLLIFISLFLAVNVGYSQIEKFDYKTVSENFEINYNKGDYKAIFSMFSSEMQQALPVGKTAEFLTGLKSQAGNINNRKFLKYENGTYASYKTTFERAIFALNISIDKNSKINGLFVKPFKDSNLPQIERNITKLKLPFNGEWAVIWGGDTKELNYHVESDAQKNAFDIIIKDKNGKSYKTNGKNNNDYYAFGKELIAPCDGEIVLVIDGIKDNKPGELNPIYIPGNTVIIKTENDEYLFFAHFKQNSIKVKQGENIKQGGFLGLCGNSGNSSEPHLHFHMQNVENMNIATGVKCFFNEIYVNGELKKNYSPKQNEIIRNK